MADVREDAAASERALRDLLDARPVAALATLHAGEPAASMVPFVLPAGGTRLLIHVSELASHTRDMRAHARVSVLVTDEPVAGASPLALARVSLAADAAFLARGGEEHAAACAAYLRRFPDAAQLFEFGDFSMVALEPVSARLVGGFGRARSLVGEPLRRWLLR